MRRQQWCGLAIFDKHNAMKKLLFLLVLLSWATLAQAQIAHDASSSVGVFFGTSSCTVSLTTSGSNRLLLVHVVTIENDYDVYTYDGVQMTLLDQNNASGDIYNMVFYLVAPNTGTHNVTLSRPGAATISACVMSAHSYTGVDQTSPIDVYNMYDSAVGGISSTTVNITTLTDNSWLFWGHRNDTNGTLTPTGFTTTRAVDASIGFATYDSGGSITPAGIASMGVTHSPNVGKTADIILAFCPSTIGCGGGGGGGGPVRPCFSLLLGVGKCDNNNLLR